MGTDCIFCKIVNGEIPSFTIYEDEELKVIFDRFPSSIGHTLLIPKKHVETIFDLDPDKGARLFKRAILISNVLKETLRFDGMNMLQNNGEAAGQTVNHFHLHLIPRYQDDHVRIGWSTSDPAMEEFEDLKNRVQKKLRL